MLEDSFVCLEVYLGNFYNFFQIATAAACGFSTKGKIIQRKERETFTDGQNKKKG